MADLRGRIALETLAGLAQELGCHAEVMLRLGQAEVTEVGRELRQQALHVGARAIPGDEAMDGEAVALIPRAG